MTAKAARAGKYAQTVDGEHERIAFRNFRESCCDCGLVHVVNHHVVDGALIVKSVRDERATAARRRGREVSAKLERLVKGKR